MKQIPKVCRNCRYFEITLNGNYCNYWISTIGAIVKAYGCEKFEPEEEK